MIRTFFKVALRNLSKHKAFSFINIFGLAVGLSCFLLLALYVVDEVSYDRFHQNADRIYRLNSNIRFGGSNLHMAVTSDMMGELLKKDYPQVENYTRIYVSSGSKMVRKQHDFITEFNVAHVDSTFFDVFTFPAIAGSTHRALANPGTVVLSESAAKKYFGSTDVVGKTIETNDRNNRFYKVTAVIRDMPGNSHFKFDFLFSMQNADYNWGQLLSHNFHTYLLLKKGTDPVAFAKNFAQYIDKYVMPQARQAMNVKNIEEFRKAGNDIEYSMIPLTHIHLLSDWTFDLSPSGSIQYVYIFSAVALFVLLIACINFMNLTTARSAGRAREVGIRKVLGSERHKLILQFLTESTLVALLAMMIAVCIVCLMLPGFNQLAAKTIDVKWVFGPVFLPFLVLMPFVVGLIAGSYPAFYLSRFRPILVLKGNLARSGSNSGLRSVLVVFQFATSIILIIGTLVIYRQLNFIRSKKLGFNKDRVLVIDNAYVLDKNLDAFKTEVLRLPGVSSGTVSSFLPVSNSSRNDNSFTKDPVANAKNGFDIQSWTVDQDYFRTMGMQLQKGRSFSRDFGGDSSAVVVSATTAKMLGYEDPIGKKIYTLGPDPTNTRAYSIIGVLNDFHFESLHQPIAPVVFFLGRSTGLVSFKLNQTNLPALLKGVETLWRTMAPGMPFSYRFMDDSFNEMYRADQRVGRIALIFSILAIFIACLGLFGLAAFIAEQRAKEIGIRKVLGATVQGIVQLLSKDFLRLVALAFLIAMPLSWYVMNRWLHDFAYRIDISWWIFVFAAIGSLGIALVTISFQAIKAAITNPVKNLRTE
jgi:putative ABC transport system permease protein